MGQKVNPIGLRLGVNRTWDSIWYEDKKNYAKYLHEDLAIKEFVDEGKEIGRHLAGWPSTGSRTGSMSISMRRGRAS